MSTVMIVAGLVLLFIGGEGLVRGSVALARRFSVSPLVIGITIVGFGTSAPEVVVGINAALVGSSGIVVGNVIGSNMANMMLILGTAAVVRSMDVHPAAMRRDATAMTAATALFVIVALDGPARLPQGLLMLGGMIAFILYSLWSDSRAEDAAAELHRSEAAQLAQLPARMWSVAAAIVLGIASLILGAKLLVDGAIALARGAGISEEVIGLTVVAVGTSLPEFATAVVAALHRQADVCLGNLLGSNIFNVLGITGAAATIAPIAFHPKILAFDLWALAAATVLLVLAMLTGRRITRIEGAALLVLYAAYLAAQFAGVARAAPPSP